MTKAGIKTEDYREITPYWVKRFFNVKNIRNGDVNDLITYLKNPSYYKNSERIVFKDMNVSKKNFSTNTMTLGYPKSSDKDRILITEHLDIEIRGGKPEWGAEPNKIYFVIKHGKIVEK